MDADVVRQVATLARLTVPEDRIGTLAAELSAILDYADQLGAIDALEPRAGSVQALARRADVLEAPLGVSLIALAGERQGDEVRVPAVMGEAP